MSQWKAIGLPEAIAFVISDYAEDSVDRQSHAGRRCTAGARILHKATLWQGTLEIMGAARENEILRAGHRAPEFSLARLANGAIQGTADLGKLLADGPVLLAFFKSSCPVCQMTLPYLERIHGGRAPGSLEIYGVSQDDPGTTQDFAVEFGISFPMLLDTEESGYPASNAYNISHVPSLFLVERDGTIAWSLEGFVKREFLAMAAQAGVNPFRAGENVPEWKAG
jgi:peroxiredoxin